MRCALVHGVGWELRVAASWSGNQVGGAHDLSLWLTSVDGQGREASACDCVAHGGQRVLIRERVFF